MANPAASDYIRYLTSKKVIDDRSLNRHVWDRLVKAVRGRNSFAPLQVLEVGCGIGTMLERLLDWGLLTRGAYTGIDVEAEFIREARRRFSGYAEKNAELKPPPPNPLPRGEGESKGPAQPGAPLLFRTADQDVRVTLTAIDLFDFLDREQGKSSWDLIAAHAVLDLVDLPHALPRLLSLLAPGGIFYFTLNFDGATIFEPAIDPDLDRGIETLYHRTMDMRRRQGQPAGSSVTGRQLIRRLRDAGARLAAAGSSDWVVFPGPDGYPGDEAYFLHSIVETIGRALHQHPDLDPDRFENWLAQRHHQIDAAELIYIAHQLDVMGYI
ncbi:MAG: class I SAM-dependent methyltransferase [Desulfobaccales bacterium]